MLDKKDFKQIQEIVNGSLFEFWDKVIVPYFEKESDKNEKQFKEIKEDIGDINRKLDRNTSDHDKMFEKFDSMEKRIEDHEKKIKNLERITSD